VAYYAQRHAVAGSCNDRPDLMLYPPSSVLLDGTFRGTKENTQAHTTLISVFNQLTTGL
jgi:hypothetical protein